MQNRIKYGIIGAFDKIYSIMGIFTIKIDIIIRCRVKGAGAKKWSKRRKMWNIS